MAKAEHIKIKVSPTVVAHLCGLVTPMPGTVLAYNGRTIGVVDNVIKSCSGSHYVGVITDQSESQLWRRLVDELTPNAHLLADDDKTIVESRRVRKSNAGDTRVNRTVEI